MITTLTTNLFLSGYCNHAHTRHDGQTLWMLVDADPTVQLYRWNYYIPGGRWELMWDLLRDEAWPGHLKPGAGHGLEVGLRSLIVSIVWKDLSGGAPGVTTYSLSRESVPPMQG